MLINIIDFFGIDSCIPALTEQSEILLSSILFPLSPMEDEQHMVPSPRRPLLAQARQYYLNPIHHPPLPLPLPSPIDHHGQQC
jgi:hypothetical protein